MRRPRLTVQVVATGLACMALGGAGQPAAAQRDEERDRRRVQPPTELLKEYPFEQGRLRSRDRSQRRSAGEATGAAQVPPDPAEDAGSDDWLTMALVLSSATALLVLGAAGRRFLLATGGPRRQGTKRNAAPPEPDLPPPERVPRAPRFQRHPEGASGRGQDAGNTYAVANQKGGVGKTTVSLVLGVAAARRGSRVLLVDLDPQASATMVLGATDHRPTVADVMREPAATSLADTVVSTEWGLDLAPAERALREIDTGHPTGDHASLTRQIDALAEYDLVLIDCPPNLGALTIDALTTASRALVVTEPTFLAAHALEELLDSLHYVAQHQNPSLELAGVVLNRLETTAEHKRALADLEGTFGSQVWQPYIPKRAVLQDAMRQGVPPQDLRSHYAEEITELFDALAGRLELSRAEAVASRPASRRVSAAEPERGG
jgi:chromosome partitioning protein